MTAQNFDMYQLIDHKKRGLSLSKAEFQSIIERYCRQQIPDYQIAALLMAIYFQNLNTEETLNLTEAMMNSGKVLSFASPNVVDKHSTGGIGDKTSFVIAPIAAAAGIKVPMMAGRGLGHTGGTVDKVESVSGFQTTLPLNEFQRLVEQNGLALIGQSTELAPADKLLYALRDVTATIDSIPLITASILSKKFAEGAQAIVMDVKYGSGAFMKEKKAAIKLAQTLVKVGNKFGKKMVAMVTDMNRPLGQTVGHSLELIECVEVLKGRGPKDLRDISLELAAAMILVGGKAKNFKAAIKLATDKLDSGEALAKFSQMIEAQSGDKSFIYDYRQLPTAKDESLIRATKPGLLVIKNNEQIGHLVRQLGGGRSKKEDHIDMAVGFTFLKNHGDKVKQGEPIVKIHHHSEQKDLVKKIEQDFWAVAATISKKKMKKTPLIAHTIWGQKKKR